MVLRKSVCDVVPGRLGADKDVRGGAQAWGVDERAECNMHVSAVSHDRVEKGAARLATGIVVLVLPKQLQRVVTCQHLQGSPLNTGEGLERCARGAAAQRAVAIQCVVEAVLDRKANRFAATGAVERAMARLVWGHAVNLMGSQRGTGWVR